MTPEVCPVKSEGQKWCPDIRTIRFVPLKDLRSSELVELAKARLGVETDADLARKLGLGVGGDKAVQRWGDDRHGPSYVSTLLLLDAAGLLAGDTGALNPTLEEVSGNGTRVTKRGEGAGGSSPPVPTSPPADLPGLARLAAVEALAVQILELNETSFDSIRGTLARLSLNETDLQSIRETLARLEQRLSQLDAEGEQQPPAEG